MPRGKISAGIAQPEDLHTAACAKLLSAVIALAVQDCCAPQIGKKRNGTGGRLSAKALDAFEFIFLDPEKRFQLFLGCLDIDPDTFRYCLVQTMRADRAVKVLPDSKRMAFRRNYALFLRDHTGGLL